MMPRKMNVTNTDNEEDHIQRSEKLIAGLIVNEKGDPEPLIYSLWSTLCRRLTDDGWKPDDLAYEAWLHAVDQKQRCPSAS